MWKRGRISHLTLLSLVACSPRPPAEPVPVAATPVAAPFAMTWDAVIDALASQNIPISTMERASGFVATQSLSVGSAGAPWADCGYTGVARLHPDHAIYNVRVREMGDSSTVQATVRFTSGSGIGYDLLRECSTTGVWETTFAESVKARAESHASGQ